MRAKILITDIDSCLSDHWRRIRRNTVPQWPGGTIEPRAFSREEVLKDSLLPHCLYILDALQYCGFQIRYLSARGWPNAREITIEQLTRWEVPNPQDVTLVGSIPEKIRMLSKDACDFYVDDFMTGQENNIGTFHADVARAIEAKGVHVIVFRNDWLDVWEQVQIYLQKGGQKT